MTAEKEFCIAVIANPITTPRSSKSILTILKDRPDWQKGRINLPGGRIEPGENPDEAAIREVKEETGYTVSSLTKVGILNDGMFKIHIFRASLKSHEYWILPKPRPGETELCEWHMIEDLMKDSRLLPNLRAIISMTVCGVEGFVIDDSARSEGANSHQFSVTVPTYRE